MENSFNSSSSSFSSSHSISQAYLADNYGIFFDMSFAWTKLRYPICGLALYLLSIKMFEPKEETTKSVSAAATTTTTTATTTTASNQSKNSLSKPTKKKFGAIEFFMLIHNIILCIFSFLTFINTFPPLFNLITTYGIDEALTTKFIKLFDGPYGYWTHLFYLSKFYEFIDTWIVIYKGRKPMFLQVYHHTGAVLCMWLVVVSKSSGGFYFVVENSFIHTIMYFYYAMTILDCPFKSKHLITSAQMIQFVLGVSGSFIQAMWYGPRMRLEDRLAIYVNDVYVIILFVLFYQFYQKSYNEKRKQA